MKKTIYITLLVSIAATLSLKAQDIHFSQFNETPMLLNPAMCGTFDGDHRAVLNYRNQWASVANPYTTYAFSYDAGLMKKRGGTGYMGAGLTLFRDVAGDNNMGTTQANAYLSYHLMLNKNNMLTGGIQGGYSLRSMDQGNEQWGSQYDGASGFDPAMPSGETSTFQDFGYADFSGGLAWNYFSEEVYSTANNALKINVGASVNHINKPKMSFYNLKDESLFTKYTVHSSFWIGLKNTNTSILPTAVYWRQGSCQEISTGLMFRFRMKEASHYTGFIKESAFSVGGYYRFRDAIIPAFQLELGSWALGFSYDVNVSGLTTASNGRGGVEMFFRFLNPNPFKKNNRAFYTPSL